MRSQDYINAIVDATNNALPPTKVLEWAHKQRVLMLRKRPNDQDWKNIVDAMLGNVKSMREYYYVFDGQDILGEDEQVWE